MPRTLATALRSEFTNSSRSRGDEYFRAGRVYLVEATATHYRAIVSGGDAYAVRLTLDASRLDVSCTCPYFLDVGEPCKHVWAAILDADQHHVMSAPERLWLHINRTPTISQAPADDELFDELDDFDDFDEFGDPMPYRMRSRAIRRVDRIRTSDTLARRQPPPPEPWRIFLANVTPMASPAPPVRALVTGELLYLFDPVQSARAGGIVIQLQVRDRKKSGDWTKPKPFSIARRDLDGLPDPRDRELLHAVCGAGASYLVSGYGYGDYTAVPAAFVLNPTLQRNLLADFCATGRFFLSEPSTPEPTSSSSSVPIRWDPTPASFRLRIRRAPDGFVVEGTVLRGDTVRPVTDARFVTSAVILWGSEPRQTPPDAGAAGELQFSPFDAGGAERWLHQLLSTGSITVPASQAELLTDILVTSDLAHVDVPDELHVDVGDTPPTPIIRLTRPEAGGYRQYERVAAELSFQYGAGEVGAHEVLPVIFDRASRSAWRRDVEAERTAAARLQSLGVRRRADWQNGATRLDISINSVPTLTRVLVGEGWRVEADGHLYRRPGSSSLEVKSGIDWFELHGYVEFEGLRATFPELLAAIRRGDGFVTLDDGSLGLVPDDIVRRYGRVMEMGVATEGHVRFTSAQAALLDAWLESQPDVTVDQTFAEARRQVAQFAGIRSIDAPATFTGTLRDYQREALGWFAFLRQFGFGGCLADEMGLGKTIMVLAALESRRLERGTDKGPRPSLVVVPRSLVFNWQQEAARFTPHLRVLDFTHVKRREAIPEIPHADLVLTTYGTLRRDIGQLKELPFDYVILDEAQAVKNARTSSAKAVRLLNAHHRLALSGTPIENHLGELWSLFEFLNPGVLGSASMFAKPAGGGRFADEESLELLRRALRPFILRRTKEQVATELPSRTEQTLFCDLESDQRTLYDELRNHYRALLLSKVSRVGLGRTKLQILEALLRLRQAACHPGLLDPARADAEAAKFEMLMPRLQELIEDGRKILVFSQFTTLLGLLRQRLDEAAITYEYLDGKTRDRQSRIERFQQGACPVFLISLKAGGVGLNLTAAEYVFLLDPWWNPATEAQAIDRTHRIGQTRPVFAYRLIARDTVEEKVLELQASKRDLANAIIRADEGVMRDLQKEDLELLLS
jgi:superfamily II DNA or RNA helicase